jgi:Protein of unknown function (DUF2934)
MRMIKMAQGNVKDRIQRRAYALWETEGRPTGAPTSTGTGPRPR